MPIRFECDQCGQRLSIARRKSGTEIDCPTCGLKQHVPGEPSADEPVESSEAVAIEQWLSETEPKVAEDPESVQIEQSDSGPPPIREEVDLSKTIDLDYPPIPPVAGAAIPLPPPIPQPSSGEPAPTVPRLPIPWAIYAQALLLLSVAAGAFSAGYYSGCQDGAAKTVEAPKREIAAVPEADNGFAEARVLLDAKLLWTPSPGKLEGDRGASFIALPRDRVPPSSLPIAGLQPAGENLTNSEASAAAIRASGGIFERAGSDGTLAAVLPREGRYYLLMISRNALRPADQPIRARDLAEMKQYFASPEELIGASKYAWKQSEIRVGAPVVEHDFGLDGL